jgi:hypothetical protein
MRRIEMAGLFPRNVLIKAFCPPADRCGAPRSSVPPPRRTGRAPPCPRRPKSFFARVRDPSWQIIVHRYSSRRNLAPRPIPGKAPFTKDRRNQDRRPRSHRTVLSAKVVKFEWSR